MKTIVYEIDPKKTTENVTIFTICSKWQDSCLAELVIRQREHIPFFLKFSNQEYRKIKKQKAWFKVFDEKYAELNYNE